MPRAGDKPGAGNWECKQCGRNVSTREYDDLEKCPSCGYDDYR